MLTHNFGILFRFLCASKALICYFIIHVLSSTLLYVLASAVPTFAVVLFAQLVLYQTSVVTIAEAALLLVAMSIGVLALYFCKSITETVVLQYMGMRVRAEVFKVLRELSPAELASPTKDSDVKKLIKAAATLTDSTTRVLAPFVVVCLTAVLFMIGQIEASPVLATLEFCALVAVSLSTPLAYHFLVKPHIDEHLYMQKLHEATCRDGIDCLTEILQFSAEDTFAEELAASRVRLKEAELKLKLRREIALQAPYVVAGIFLLVSAESALSLITHGAISTTEALSSIVLMLFSFVPAVAFALSSEYFETSFAANELLANLFEKLPATDYITDGYIPEHFSGASFRNVDFSYPGSDVELIRHINLEIPAAKFVALTGAAGSGKTTIARLLMGYHYPTEGAVVVSGARIDAIDTKRLRSLIAYVPEETALFAGTIRDNLILANEHATDRELALAVKLSGLSASVSKLEDGLMYRIEPQHADEVDELIKAQIGLARAMLSGAECIILDDPTMRLTAKDEVSYLAALQYHKRSTGKTIVMLTNRPKATDLADIVLCVEKLQLH